MATATGKHMQPKDWELFRQEMHRLVDVCVDRLRDAQSYPWQPVPSHIKESYDLNRPLNEPISETLIETVLPYHTGNTHPRFFGWVHGTGLASGLISELVSATMNSNCGGRDHGMVYIERAVIDWAKSVFGFPETASGVLVTGTSQATVLALSAARVQAMGPSVRQQGSSGALLVVYAGAGVHNAIKKAVELLGIGTDNLRLVPNSNTPLKGIDVKALGNMIAQDLESGLKPLAIIGTAGSVDCGMFDDFHGLADVADRYDLWLHIDGAFGAWTRISADTSISALTSGIERATSIACDFHKWMYVPYDCGMVLMRSGAQHRAAFAAAARPSYLAGQQTGIAGGDPWFCDYGVDLSRGARALRVWTALKHYGQDTFARAITDNCYLARYMEKLIQGGDHSITTPIAGAAEAAIAVEVPKARGAEKQISSSLSSFAPASAPSAGSATVAIVDTAPSLPATAPAAAPYNGGTHLLQLAVPAVVSNIVVFTARRDMSADAQSAVNKSIAAKLQLDGTGVLSTTLIDGVWVLRAAITNHRTTYEDIDIVIAAVIEAAAAAAATTSID